MNQQKQLPTTIAPEGNLAIQRITMMVGAYEEAARELLEAKRELAAVTEAKDKEIEEFKKIIEDFRKR